MSGSLLVNLQCLVALVLLAVSLLALPRAYLRAAEGTTWRTIEHQTHVEYQTLIKDLVLESEYLGEQA